MVDVRRRGPKSRCCPGGRPRSRGLVVSGDAEGQRPQVMTPSTTSVSSQNHPCKTKISSQYHDRTARLHRLVLLLAPPPHLRRHSIAGRSAASPDRHANRSASRSPPEWYKSHPIPSTIAKALPILPSLASPLLCKHQLGLLMRR